MEVVDGAVEWEVEGCDSESAVSRSEFWRLPMASRVLGSRIRQLICLRAFGKACKAQKGLLTYLSGSQAPHYQLEQGSRLYGRLLKVLQASQSPILLNDSNASIRFDQYITLRQGVGSLSSAQLQ